MYRFYDDIRLPMPPQQRSVFEDPREDVLAVFLLQVFVTLILSKILAKLLAFIHQPAVIGQILAGIILGPSALGFIPGFSGFLFAPHTLNSLQLVASLGLIFFMFYLGLKMDPNEIRQGWRRTLPIASVSIIVPVGIGCAVSLWLYQMSAPGVNKISFILFIGRNESIGTARLSSSLDRLGSGVGFSAFPVLASILQSNNIVSTSLGEYETFSFAERHSMLSRYLDDQYRGHRRYRRVDHPSYRHCAERRWPVHPRSLHSPADICFRADHVFSRTSNLESNSSVLLSSRR